MVGGGPAKEPSSRQAGSPAPGPIISAWVEYKSAKGRPYWYHPGERRSVWDKPDELKTARERAMETTAWREYKSGERSYYVNKETKASTWTMPADLKAFLDTIPDEPAPAVPGRGSASPASGDASPSTPRTPTFTQTAMTVADTAGTGTAVVRPAPSQARTGTLMYTTQEEAESAFVTMLRAKGIGAHATWEQVLRDIVTEPRYKALRTLEERKATFKKYVEELQEIEAAQREEKLAELRPVVLRALQQNGGLKPYASFATFKKKLERHPVWRDFDDEPHAHTLYEAILHDVREKDAARKKSVQQHNRSALGAFFKTIEMTPMTLWQDVHRTLVESDEFRRDARLQKMPPADMLALFEEHMESVEKDAERALATREEPVRHEREVRDAFRALLQEYVDAGTLHARCTWASFYAQIRDDERLAAMAETHGSSAQVLCYDRLDQLEREFAVHRRTIQAHMRQQQVPATQPSDWDAWHAACCAADAPQSVSQLPERVQRALFDECVYQAEREAREARRRVERRLRHYADDLRYAFKHAHPPLDIHASFDDVFEQVRAMPEMQELMRMDGGLDAARGAWDKYVRRQAERRADAPEASGAHARSEYADLDDAEPERKRKDPARAEDPRAVRRRTEYDM
ncbi:U1 snRNP protein [Malassezia caprae]|uniref:U1 snRNP protein n=1 Tax=Malassezia caprae TaxID=1381934 RepID=A0AAF0EAR8_9BASI|nr:U1 snRNP protein [Malassezia caprae]